MSIQNAYDEWSQTYDRDENLTRDLDKQVLKEMLTNLPLDPSILEIGCGTGKNTIFLAQIAASVHAIDFSKGMIEQARKKVQARKVRFSIADLTQTWPCEYEAYDLIVCNLVLEHIRGLSFIFEEAFRVLRREGNFLVNELHPFRQYEGKKARFQRGDQVMEIPAFVHHISDFVRAASEHGLRLATLKEWWHEEDHEGKPPRLISFLFEK